MNNTFLFGKGLNEANPNKEILGNKGANLVKMVQMGIPVPPGFIISTKSCKTYFDDHYFQESFRMEIMKSLKIIEDRTGRRLGDHNNPLLLSCRSSASISMPGMMDSIFNIGLNRKTMAGLLIKTGNDRFVYDSYRRFLLGYAEVALGITSLKSIQQMVMDNDGCTYPYEMSMDGLKGLCNTFERVLGNQLSDSPSENLWACIGSIFDSWSNPRAVTYRSIQKISEDLGTAVILQVMSFGNMGENSGSGVIFTRNPGTGEREIFGEWVRNAQGQDLVSGSVTPEPISTLEESMPDVYFQLSKYARKIETNKKAMQDIEFTIEEGKLFFLQTRDGKSTAKAAMVIARDMYLDGTLQLFDTVERAYPRIKELKIPELVSPESGKVLATGLPVSPGVAVGQIVMSTEEAIYSSGQGRSPILVCKETNPDDVEGIRASGGILTSTGGATSHAALVAREWGKPCIVGASEITVNGGVLVKGKTFYKGDWITLDGSTGTVYEGAMETRQMMDDPIVKEIVDLMDQYREEQYKKLV